MAGSAGLQMRLMTLSDIPMPDDLNLQTGRTILIAGPTASGKTATALSLARLIEGAAEIVNADAMQVYRDVPILSAQPTLAERGDVPHHLFGYLAAADRCSAGRWARDAGMVLKKVWARGGTAIIVGGTGLYFRALTDGLSEIPDIPDEVKSAGQKRLSEIGVVAFRAEVLARDPAMSWIKENDLQRHLRAWEVVEATGRPLSAWQEDAPSPIVPVPEARIVLAPPREALYQRCDARFDQMMNHGALQEAETLLAQGVSDDLPVMKALGAAELMAHLRGDISLLDDAIDRAKMNTRRLAKRQLTWFRNQTADWPRVETSDQAVQSLSAQLAV